MTPFVSICVPTYNGKTYIRQCLDSILAQTFENFEVLIVDDQSSDETVSVAQEYAERDRRIRLVQNEHNLGLVGNWNRCIELAQGEWIKFVFQDDLIAPECLERMLAYKDSGKPVICCYRNFIFDSETLDSICQYYLSLPLLESLFPDSNVVSAKSFLREVFKHTELNIIGEPTAVMVRRSIFYELGVFNANLVQLCDWEMWVRILSNVGFIYLNEPLATFRVHGTSTSSMNVNKRWYSKDVLDPLLIVHDFAFHPLYANLRSCALSNSPPIDILKLFLFLTYRAKRIAFQTANSGGNDRPCLKEWNKMAKLYPLIAKTSKSSYLYNRVKALIKYCLSKLNFASLISGKQHL